jgi:hypothetical protein
VAPSGAGVEAPEAGDGELLTLLKKHGMEFGPCFVFGQVPHLRRSLSLFRHFPALPGWANFCRASGACLGAFGFTLT